jgi:hypothetical protein
MAIDVASCSRMLKADELLVVTRKAVGKFFPPALLRRVLGEREKERTARSGDPGVVEQSLDFPWPQAGPGPLNLLILEADYLSAAAIESPLLPLLSLIACSSAASRRHTGGLPGAINGIPPRYRAGGIAGRSRRFHGKNLRDPLVHRTHTHRNQKPQAWTVLGRPPVPESAQTTMAYL